MNKSIACRFKLNIKQCGTFTVVILVGIVLSLSQGCTLRSTYNDKVSELDACNAHDAEMTDKLVALQNTRNDLTEELERRKQASERMNALYSELLMDLKGEIDSSQLVLKQMKSGVNVHLPQHVLFSSGSAEVTEDGRKVLLHVGAELAELPYQTLVGGYTDNIPVSANLAKQYPSNWELAGARAASVVRVLEEAGVSGPQLGAISAGKYKPIASNDTPEGRAQNRRIVIRLRPIVPEE
jgi:chemotaxis protein MotB